MNEILNFLIENEILKRAIFYKNDMINFSKKNKNGK